MFNWHLQIFINKKNHVHGFAILKNTALVYCIKWDSKNYPTILDASVVKYDTS